MGKKLTRRPRSKDGVIYSDIGKTIKKFIKMYGRFDDKGFMREYNVYRKAAHNMSIDDEIGIFIAFIARRVFLFEKPIGVYIKTPYLLDFLKKLEIKKNDHGAMINSIKENKPLLNKGVQFNLPNEKNSIVLKLIEDKNSIDIINKLFEGLYEEEDPMLFLFFIARGDEFKSFVFIFKNQHVVVFPRLEQDNKNIYATETTNIALNALIYMDCFKECVIDGVPDIDCRSDTAKIKKTITLHRDIEEVCRQAQITPHMRRGHFRFLQSEKFVNAKGKTVYVKPAMVKGKAKTVIEYT